MGTWNHVKNELVPKYWKRYQVGVGTLHTWTHRYTYPSQSPASLTDKMGTQMQKSYAPKKGEEKNTISMTEVLRQKKEYQLPPTWSCQIVKNTIILRGQSAE